MVVGKKVVRTLLVRGRDSWNTTSRPECSPWNLNSNTKVIFESYRQGNAAQEDSIDSVLHQVYRSLVGYRFWGKDDSLSSLVKFNSTRLPVKRIPKHVKVAHELNDFFPLIYNDHLRTIVGFFGRISEFYSVQVLLVSVQPSFLRFEI